MITFDEVGKIYPDGTVAVDSLDLVAPTGKITVFVGPSGCGKTTCLRVINRMIDPTSGRVLIDETDVAVRDAADLRRGIGYVIQHAGLFPHRTVEDNIGTVLGLLGVSRRRARIRAAELMETVGLSPALARRYPAQLSGGQRQRVGVARALAADPPILLMDEPFSAVDPVVRDQLRGELRRLQDELGKTIVFVTHDIDEAVELGDQVAVFREGGRLAQIAAPRELLTRPADEFVAEFVGRDRGYRSLSFGTVRDLPVRPVSALEGLELVTNADQCPEGWRIDGAIVPLSGTFREMDSPRVVIDLAITSPNGLAVRVDEGGRVLGVVSHADVAEYARRARTDARQAGGGPS